MTLHTKLISLRKQKGLTQMDLAQKLNVSRQAISRWEVGAAVPSTDNLKVLAELYGVQIDYLLNDEIKVDAEKEQGSKNIPIESEPAQNNVRRKPLVLFVMAVVVVIVVLLLIFVPINGHQDQSIPMECMHTETKGDYSEGTFEFK